MHIAALSPVSTGRRVCADASRPLRRVPPAERGRAVALCRYGCQRRGGAAPAPACWQRGGICLCGTVPVCPTVPARPISASACPLLLAVRSGYPAAPSLPFSCLRSGSAGGSVAPVEQSAVRSCLPNRPRPHLSLARRAWCPSGTVPIYPTVPARPIRVFVRSPFGGRKRPSRIPTADRSKFDRRSESQ